MAGPRAFSGAYDMNGNMVARIVDGGGYMLTYNAENRLVGVTGGGVNASFSYDRDGNRVQSIVITTLTTAYLGNYYEYEVNNTTITQRSYYYAGSTRVAMRTGSTLNYLMGDQLGSTAITTDSSGQNPAELRYYPWGGVRYSSGTTPTSFKFTGQRLEDYIKLYWYGSRWFDASLARFIQPDAIIPEPESVLDWDRYSYARNNPLRYTDPTGHCPEDDDVCWARLEELEQTYGIDIDTENYGMAGVEVWSLITLYYLQTSLERMVGLIGAEAFASMIGGTVFRLDSSLESIGQYDPVGENRLTADKRVVSLNPGFSNPDVGGYRDGWTPIIHEMWHGVDDWVSKDIYGQQSSTYFSTHDYATLTGVGPPCTPDCDWDNYDWEERPYEDFAQIATLVTNIAAERPPYGMVAQHPNEIWRIYTIGMYIMSWLTR